MLMVFFFFQAEDGIRDVAVTGVQTCALPIWYGAQRYSSGRGRGASRGSGLAWCARRTGATRAVRRQRERQERRRAARRARARRRARGRRIARSRRVGPTCADGRRVAIDRKSVV